MGLAALHPELFGTRVAAVAVTRDSRSATGHFFIDEDVLAEAGITDLDRYAVRPGAPLMPDLFVD